MKKEGNKFNSGGFVTGRHNNSPFIPNGEYVIPNHLLRDPVIFTREMFWQKCKALMNAYTDLWDE